MRPIILLQEYVNLLQHTSPFRLLSIKRNIVISVHDFKNVNIPSKCLVWFYKAGFDLM